jgi:hypothetical protein
VRLRSRKQRAFYAQLAWRYQGGSQGGTAPRMPGGGPMRPAAQDMSLRDVVRFYGRVAITFSGCWEWQGTPSQPYGAFSVGNQNRKAHRIAYELTYGPIPDGMVVMHRCDNGRCVRADHLRAGTPRDNTQDMISKGRFRNQNSRKFFCWRGHQDWAPRPGGTRACRSCERLRSKERHATPDA